MSQSDGFVECLERRWMFAGVTLVTHGYQDGFDADPWVAAMATSIADLAGPQTPIYQLKITMGMFGNPFVPDSGFKLIGGAPASSAANSSGEVVMILDWAGASGVAPGWYNRTDTIASIVAPYLLSSFPTIGINHPLAELPVHLIGHSRGGSVVAELARDLGEADIWVDQLTTLDPHPCNARDTACALLLRDDPDVTIAENVFFADNYYQTYDYPDGTSLAGAANLDLTDDVPSHSGIHDYYQESIDIPGSGVGYDFSRLRGGQRHAYGISKYFENPGGEGERWSVSRQGSQWPNIGSLTIRDSDGIITRGAPLPVRFLYQDADSSAAIHFYLDGDRNPYNNGVYSIGNQSPQSTGASVFFWNTEAIGTAQAPAGRYNLLAMISDASGHARYTYADRLVTLANRPPSIALLTAPKTVRKPSRFVLQAMGVTMGSAAVRQTAFFLDANRNGRYDASDKLLGRDNSPAGGWRLTVNSRTLRNGSNRFFAFAFDGLSWSQPRAVSVRVRA